MADLLMILYVLAGIGIGFAASLLGLGGGSLLVPMLTLVFGIPIHQAIGTSLFTIVFTSSSGSIEYVRKRIADLKLGAMMIPFTIIGAVVGANLSAQIPENILKAIFGVVLFIASIRMFLRKNRQRNSASKSLRLPNSKFLTFKRTFTDIDDIEFEYTINIPLLALFGFCAGFLSGLLGIGGGIVQVPLLNIIFGVPIHVAIATSLFIIIFTSSFGTATHLILGNVLITVGILLVIGTIIGSQIGSRVAQKIERERLRRIFAIVLAFTGIRMAVSFLIV
ncbi:MAG: sulfite exporter TauE/SafE family protein [Promethearchaeota archaeon]